MKFSYTFDNFKNSHIAVLRKMSYKGSVRFRAPEHFLLDDLFGIGISREPLVAEPKVKVFWNLRNKDSRLAPGEVKRIFFKEFKISISTFSAL